MLNAKENAINFLLYESMKLTLKEICGTSLADVTSEALGRTPDDEQKNYLEKILDKAFDDATLQGAFNASVYKKDASGDEDARENVLSGEELKIRIIGKDANGKKVPVDGGCSKERAGKLIVEFIKGLCEDGNFADNYDQHHHKLCMDICGEFGQVFGKRTNEFSYGNAQKWVNMTMKYLYIIQSIKIEFGCDDDVAMYSLAEKLHVPVDSFIIEAVWNMEKEIFVKDKAESNASCLPDIKLNKDGSYGAYAPEKVKAWSKWNQDDYKNFREKFKENILKESGEEIPLHWEGGAWTAVAGERRK